MLFSSSSRDIKGGEIKRIREGREVSKGSQKRKTEEKRVLAMSPIPTTQKTD